MCIKVHEVCAIQQTSAATLSVPKHRILHLACVWERASSAWILQANVYQLFVPMFKPLTVLGSCGSSVAWPGSSAPK